MTPKKIHILTRDLEILGADTPVIRAWVNLNPHEDRTEYTDLSQVWHNAKEEPEKGKSIISIGVTGVSAYKWVDEWRCDWYSQTQPMCIRHNRAAKPLDTACSKYLKRYRRGK